MSDKILPCPFCGSQPIGYSVSIDDLGVACSVGCDTRGCRGNQRDFDSRKEAIAAWNWRVSHPRLDGGEE